MTPQMQVYSDDLGRVYLAQEVLPPRYNCLTWYVPKRHQFILYLFDKDADITLTSSYLSFRAMYNDITYEGLDSDGDTIFSDLGIVAGMIFNITGSALNNIKINILGVVDGIAEGTTEHLSETDFSVAITEWTETGTNWDLTIGAFANYVWTDNDQSILIQALVDMANPVDFDEYYVFSYTVTETTPPVNDSLEFYLEANEIAAVKTVLPHTAGTHKVKFYSAPNSDLSPFQIYVDCDNGSAGDLKFDNFSLVKAGTGQVLKVTQDLTDEAEGSSVTIAQDPAGICFVVDMLTDRFVKFEGMNIISVAVMAGGDQLHNLNLFLTNNGTINMYPDDDDGVYTTETAYVQTILQFYNIDCNKLAINFDNSMDCEVEMTIEDESQGQWYVQTLDIDTDANNLAAINIPRPFHGNKLTLTFKDFDKLKYFILHYVERMVR